MGEIVVRPAAAADRHAVAACVDAAYAKWVLRFGRKPGPMLADYRELIALGRVWIATEGNAVQGILVLLPEPDHLLVWNVAVWPDRQGRGIGRRLLAFAEERAAALGLREVRLFTNELMAENIAFYRGLGYEETERREEGAGRRVYMRKAIAETGAAPLSE